MKTVRCLQQLIVKEHGRAGAWQRLHEHWGVTIRPSSKRAPSTLLLAAFITQSSHPGTGAICTLFTLTPNKYTVW